MWRSDDNCSLPFTLSRTQSDFKTREKCKKGMTLACLEKLAKMQKGLL